MSPYETVWSFSTANFTINLDIAPEDDDPEGHFAAGDDAADAEMVATCREGGWAWFTARVQVLFGAPSGPDIVVGADYLGACSYRNREDFLKGPYFRDMVSEAISEARTNRHAMPVLRAA